MTITVDAVSAADTFAGTNSASTSLSLGVGHDRLVVANIAFLTIYETPPTVTFNGVAMTLALTHGYARLYYMLDASLPIGGSSYTLSVTAPENVYGAISCMSVMGVEQIAPEATGYGSDPSPVSSWSNNVTTLTDNAMLFDCCFMSVFSATPGTGQTERTDQNDGDYTMLASTKATTTYGVKAMAWTPSAATSYSQVIAAWRPRIFYQVI